jgi:hypothetical protein
MAKSLGGTELFNNSLAPAYPLRAVWMLRLALGLTVLLGATLFFLGTSWDIQWHTFIGRDRTLIPPHIVMLTGVTISGLAALAAVLIETLWSRRNQFISNVSTGFADTFHGSLGAYIAGFGALDAGVAFPLDSYWHSLYGIDVTIWAPFHIMFAVGMAIVAFGSLYMLLSATHLAMREHALGGRRIAATSAAIALAICMCIFTFLLFDAYGDQGTLQFGFMIINAFMPLAALLGAWTFVTAAFAFQWRWAATAVAAISLLFAGIVYLVVPPLTNWLTGIEHLAYRRPGPHPAVVSIDWPALFIVAAILIDIIVHLGRRRGWSTRKLTLIVAAISLIGFLPAPIGFAIYPYYLATELGITGSIVSLLLGLAGALVGSWLGRSTGESLHALEG